MDAGDPYRGSRDGDPAAPPVRDQACHAVVRRHQSGVTPQRHGGEPALAQRRLEHSRLRSSWLSIRVATTSSRVVPADPAALSEPRPRIDACQSTFPTSATSRASPPPTAAACGRASCCAARCRRPTTSSPTISPGRPRSSSTCGRRSSCGTGIRSRTSRPGWSTSRCCRRCVPATRASESLVALYRVLLEDAAHMLVDLVHEVADADGPVLVHCAAGKDRTGVGVALVLRLLGVRARRRHRRLRAHRPRPFAIDERLHRDRHRADCRCRSTSWRPRRSRACSTSGTSTRVASRAGSSTPAATPRALERLRAHARVSRHLVMAANGAAAP